jgi:LmbE family N-acetylglucosaminyl deacetylase
LAKYASEGVETYLVTATRGERGRFGNGIEFPGFAEVGRMREAELLAAARLLGVREVRFLGYMDGELDQAQPADIIARIAAELRQIRPQVVVTFGPEGAYGHPDHIAISQFTTAASVCAADPSYSAGPTVLPHRVSKLYYMAWSQTKWEAYKAAFRDVRSMVDGIERRATPWPSWALTTIVNTHEHWQTVWQAVCCHKTQLAIYSQLENLAEDHHRAMWGTQEFYRVFSLVNGGRRRETDLFDGLR